MNTIKIKPIVAKITCSVSSTIPARPSSSDPPEASPPPPPPPPPGGRIPSPPLSS